MKWMHHTFWPLFLIGIGLFFISLLGWSMYQSVVFGSSPVERVETYGPHKPSHD